MAAGTYNTTLDQGSTFQRSFQLTRNDGSIIDLTGYTFAGQIRKLPKDTGTPVASFTIVQDPVIKNQMNVTIPAAITTTIPVAAVASDPTAKTRYYYDIEITSPTSVVTRIVSGTIDVSPEVTK